MVSPFFIPLIFGLFYGYFTKTSGSKRVTSYIIKSLLISTVSGILLQITTRGFCSIDGGQPCPFNFYYALVSTIFAFLISYPFMYLGVIIKYLIYKSSLAKRRKMI